LKQLPVIIICLHGKKEADGWIASRLIKPKGGPTPKRRSHLRADVSHCCDWCHLTPPLPFSLLQSPPSPLYSALLLGCRRFLFSFSTSRLPATQPSLSPLFSNQPLLNPPHPIHTLSVLFPLLALPPSLASCSAFDSPLVAVAVPGSSSHLAGASGILFLASLPPPAPYPGQSAQDLLFSGAGGASRLLLEGKAERQESSGRETRTEPNQQGK
jgi:hypothetical protein